LEERGVVASNLSLFLIYFIKILNELVMNYKFEWDINKAHTNLLKHKISFESAVSVFRDERAISIFDDEHSDDEERWLTIGMDEVTRTLVVIHTFISIDKNNYHIRLISARKATKKEQEIYNKG
jgi:uncharacterized DUF497 family protein